jgi:CDP-diacylglycerol--glycerol-3-phosphate 3-phosphatidyltransferase
MNLSSSLTFLRILFVPPLVALLLSQQPGANLWAAAVFLLAAATDLLDGYFARKREQITTLGIILDPIADKILTSAAFICLVELHLVPAWMVVVIVGREFAVSGLRGIASAEGLTIAPSQLGKTKMVFQVFSITVIVLEPRYGALHLWAQVLLWLVVVFALVSAAEYFWSFWKGLGRRPEGLAARHVVVLPGGEEEQREKEQEHRDVAAH